MIGKHLRGSTFRLITSAAIFSFTGVAQTHIPLRDPIPALIPDSGLQVALKPVASGFVAPTWAASAPGDHRHLYVADQPGQLWEVTLPRHDDDEHGNRDTAQMEPPRMILDLSSLVVKVGLFPPLNYDERGFLSVVFHPQFRRNGLFYTFTSEKTNGIPDFSTMPAGVAPNCQTVIREWHAARQREDRFDDNDSYGISVDPTSSRVLLRIDKPQFNHNGGTLAFGRDGMLYISLGDGGNANDVGVGHVPGGNAQSLEMHNVLGKILRIDPSGSNSANGQYGIPYDNPFARSGAGPAEVWAYGFRNPFRMSFDYLTGRLIAGDVGQNDIEEVDIVHRNANYGWPIKEGTFLFDNGASRPAPDTNTGFVYASSPGIPAGLVDPIAEYDHADGPPPAPEVRVAVVGGYVYRGREMRDLRGRYIFGDYSGEIGSIANGHLFTIQGGMVKNIRVQGRSQLGMAVLSFGQDERGELYLLANATGTVNGKTGQVLRIATTEGFEHDRDFDRRAGGRNDNREDNDGDGGHRNDDRGHDGHDNDHR